ncbi:protein of unknown function [Streptomyces sp. KY75]|nr:protein of unknown function [Streptomyces sp. KY75]CAD5989152.1 protein of unknown function [Streptomyces sp. KY70]
MGARGNTLPSLEPPAMTCVGATVRRRYGDHLRKRVFVLARESARVQHVAGTRKRSGKDKRT